MILGFLVSEFFPGVGVWLRLRLAVLPAADRSGSRHKAAPTVGSLSTLNFQLSTARAFASCGINREHQSRGSGRVGNNGEAVTLSLAAFASCGVNREHRPRGNSSAMKPRRSKLTRSRHRECSYERAQFQPFSLSAFQLFSFSATVLQSQPFSSQVSAPPSATHSPNLSGDWY